MPTLESLAELARIAPDVCLVRHQNHVALFIVVPEAGVILVDPIGQLNPRVPDLIKAAIATVTDESVKYVVYSHSSADHSMGGAIFANTAQFVGHRLTAERMAAAKDRNLPPPTITFDTRFTLELGGRRLDLYPADLWQEDDYLILHDAADHLEFDTLVSGHATPRMTATRDDVLEAARYYEDLSEAVEQARRDGLSDHSLEMHQSVRAALDEKYGHWRRFDEMLDLNVEGMLRWRAGERLGHFLGAPD
jgi:glyoxylase-like metal-dependent hydrolase (beta-lactamase superfamily II)